MTVAGGGGAPVDAGEQDGSRVPDAQTTGRFEESSDRRTDAPASRDRAARAPGGVAAPATDLGAGPLSGRESEIARLLLLNLTYSQIGEKLFLSPKTVEHHVARMKQRLGVSRRSELFDALRALAGSHEGALR